MSLSSSSRTWSPDWVLIRNLGRVKYFGISYAVLVFVPVAASFSWFPINLNIKYAYLASIFYAFAIALYQFMCPKIIKDYEKEQEYVRDNLDMFLREYADLKIEIILPNLNKLEVDQRVRIERLIRETEKSPDNVDLKSELAELVNSIYPKSVQRVLITEYNEAMNKHQWAIWISGLFYCLGTLIVLGLLIGKSIDVFTH